MEVTAKDIRGNTALHYAAANGLRRCVEYLVAHGAEVFLDNYDGLTVSFFVQKIQLSFDYSFLNKKILLKSNVLRSNMLKSKKYCAI